jgi:hypothetical protein
MKASILTLHYKLAILAEGMSELIQYADPLLRPLLRTIRPSARPLDLPPRVTQHHKSLAFTLHRA